MFLRFNEFNMSMYKLKKAKRKISIKTLQEDWKIIEHKSDGGTNCNWCAQYSHQNINKGTGERGNKRTSGDHPNDIVIKIGQNTKKSSGDLRRLDITQTPVENHQLTLIGKILKSDDNNNNNNMGLWHTNGSPNLGKKTRPYSNQQQKKRTFKFVDFAVPADRRMKLRESEKKD